MDTFVDGEGFPLVFLHGYGGSKESFAFQLPYFANYFKVYAPDLSGFTKPLPYAYSLEDYSREFLAFLDETGEKEFYVLCHSFGARVLLKSLPDSRIKKIVFTGAAGLKPRRGIDYYAKIWAYKSIKAIFGKNCAQKISKKTCSAEYYNLSEVQKQSFKKIVNEHLDHKLDLIDVPTLILQGRDDAETPMYMAKRLKKGIRDSALITLSGGHFAFIDDRYNFNLIAKDFLSA